ncbi:MAG: hypothetical protein IJ214_00610 [Clostridia bacterium]|nr:hypothetical protein [Clostridia bacterium]
MTTENRKAALRGFALRVRRWDYTPLLLCWATAVFYAFFCLYIGIDPVGSSGYNTYTLQALAWRSGSYSLGQDYPWLELATYQGDWYVSFPPVPTIPLFFLTFLFGGATPDNLLVKLYLLAGCLSVYRMLRRARYDKLSAVGFTLFFSFASCLVALTTEGGVWYQAQMLAYALTCAAIACMFCRKITASLICYAFAVGCRPFNAIYGLPLLAQYAMLYRPFREKWQRAARQIVPGVLCGLLVAFFYGWYNYIRFGNPLEFGHNYLPEFSWQGGTQFSVAHIAQNLKSFVLRMPFALENGEWRLSHFGFCFLIANPVFILFLFWIAADLIRRRFTWTKAIIFFSCAVHLFLLLLHRTFGGFQFGARYTCDLLPYAALYLAQEGRVRRMLLPEKLLLVPALFFSLYGAASILL